MAKKTVKKDESVEVVEVKKERAPEPKVVRCVTPFYDIKVQTMRSANDQWQVTDERVEELLHAGKAQGMVLIEVL